MPQKSRVVIVDDQQSLCKPLALFLQQEYEVSARVTVPEGLSAFVQSGEKSNVRDRFAVAIVDLRFENLDLGNASEESKASAGLRLISEARRDPFLEVILITAHGAEAPASEALQNGVFRYIIKGPGEDVTRSWMEEVSKAIAEAVAVRERWLALFEDLKQIEAEVNRIDAMVPDEHSRTAALHMYIKDALTNYNRLLLTRGHHPG